MDRPNFFRFARGVCLVLVMVCVVSVGVCVFSLVLWEWPELVVVENKRKKNERVELKMFDRSGAILSNFRVIFPMWSPFPYLLFPPVQCTSRINAVCLYVGHFIRLLGLRPVQIAREVFCFKQIQILCIFPKITVEICNSLSIKVII